MSARFDLLPAIDLRGGRVVRLAQGDFARETEYGDDPAAVAEAFEDQGAERLHIVDLDGAREGEPRQAAAIAAILDRVGKRVACEVAGGLRSINAVDAALAAGAARVVLGTAALRDPDFARQVVARHGPDHMAAAIDVRNGRALGGGWMPGTAGVNAEEAVRRLAEAGVRTFEVTAIERDGLLGGPDLALLGRVVEMGRGAVIASGGIGRLEDLTAVREIGCTGAILGRALYEGRFTLGAALDYASAAANQD